MADFARLAVTTADGGGTEASDASTVTVTGEIDFATSPQLRQALVDVLHTNGRIGVLVGAANLANSGGGQLILRHPTAPCYSCSTTWSWMESLPSNGDSRPPG